MHRTPKLHAMCIGTDDAMASPTDAKLVNNLEIVSHTDNQITSNHLTLGNVSSGTSHYTVLQLCGSAEIPCYHAPVTL